jgi:hypothetical protein
MCNSIISFVKMHGSKFDLRCTPIVLEVRMQITALTRRTDDSCGSPEFPRDRI